MKKGIVFLLVLLLAITIGGMAYAEEYRIGVEDMLQISVWGNNDLSVHVPVRPDGMISMPLVGDVKAAGLTPYELKKNLEKDLTQFVRAPIVTVIVTAINSCKVFILREGGARIQNSGSPSAGSGENAAAPGGAASGQFTLRRNTTLLQFMAQIGVSGDINFKKAYLLREGQKLNVNFEKLFYNQDVSEDVKLECNDTVYLPGGFSSHINVTGAVKVPGTFSYTPGMTALDAVLAAGGFTDYANPNNVVVVRTDGNTTTNIKAKLKDVINGNLNKNVLLKPGDLVNVKTGLF
jgi:polysaccharide biosynthesis/export protein